MTHGASLAVFVAQLIVLLTAGRALGELMQRVGQPPVIGQILAGVLLGPSVLGTIAPAAFHVLFPDGATQKAMLDAVAQLGILLLLLLTGMETDLSVFREARRPAISISLSGIVIPFLCGLAVGLLLPPALLPHPEKRLITALFLGTALAISSVKIVALVVRDLGFVRRTIGQIILAAAILDDTIGWIIMAVTFGLALRGTIDLTSVAQSVIGTLLFLTLSFTIGRRLVFRLIRWSNDHLQSELAMITSILVACLLLALLTNAVGVHFVLGAFVAGVLVGQSPILTKRIDSQLRGLIVALFMPVFFATAGLSADLRALAHPDLLLLTAVLIAVASLGKFSGAFLGGRLGGLSYAESLAVGCGMNARGSTEVIVASIGLAMAVLDQRLFTAIVAMAVVTTTAMPPTLRWALRRLPVSAEEKARLEREEFEAQGFLKQVERVLVAVDGSGSGRLASRLVGLLAGVRHLPTTVLQLPDVKGKGRPAPESKAQRSAQDLKAGVERGDAAADPREGEVEVLTRKQATTDPEAAIAAEAKRGYGLLVVGREPTAHGARFDPQITRSARDFAGPFAITIARGPHAGHSGEHPLRILVPITGTRVSRHGAEVAVALAQASQGSLTAPHFSPTRTRVMPWRQRFGRVIAPRATARAAIREIVELGEHYGLNVAGEIRSGGDPKDTILAAVRSGKHDLLVMGVSPRPGEELFFGEVTAGVLADAPCSLLLISAEAAAGTGVAAGADSKHGASRG
jgi:Kef-type K+ transport system membrane component KefB/nucleotide-binding universal stress UspA family protein